jgi:hypothetical protein
MSERGDDPLPGSTAAAASAKLTARAELPAALLRRATALVEGIEPDRLRRLAGPGGNLDSGHPGATILGFASGPTWRS